MNKDVIYIDVEDDITDIIGKIKSSRGKIVALVPPKRVGVLQSAVNLQLLARSAENNKKHLVIITHNQALIALTAIAKIPVAKNLQSRPEVAEIAALEIDDGEDVIDGKQLPIGELAKTVKRDDNNTAEEALDDIDIEAEESAISSGATNDAAKTAKATKASGIKVPDSSRFRKKLFAGILIAPFIVWFFVWAIWFAPSAKVIITAKTSAEPVSLALKLGGTAATDISKNIVQTISQQIKKDISVDFTATGKKDLGNKASGVITVRNCDYSEGFTLPAGTEFTSDNDLVYVSTESVSVPGFSGSSSACQLSGNFSGKADVDVSASSSGDLYNNDGSLYLIGSIPVFAKVDAVGESMTGGTTRLATVVTVEDVQKAGQALVDLSTDSYKQQLIKKFASGETVIVDSFAVERAESVSSPAVGEEAASGKATLTSTTTFSIIAIAKSELEAFLKDALNKQLDNNSQRIYDNGISKVKLSGYFKSDQGASVNVSTSGKIGPNIDQEVIKKEVMGLQYGDIQELIGRISGVSDVDTKFSYFWVNTVPNDVDKIKVEFVLEDA